MPRPIVCISRNGRHDGRSSMKRSNNDYSTRIWLRRFVGESSYWWSLPIAVFTVIKFQSSQNWSLLIADASSDPPSPRLQSMDHFIRRILLWFAPDRQWSHNCLVAQLIDGAYYWNNGRQRIRDVGRHLVACVSEVGLRACWWCSMCSTAAVRHTHCVRRQAPEPAILLPGWPIVGSDRGFSCELLLPSPGG